MVQAKYEIMEAAERSPVCYCLPPTRAATVRLSMVYFDFIQFCITTLSVVANSLF